MSEQVVPMSSNVHAARAVLESELASWRQHVSRKKTQHVTADAAVLRRFAVSTGGDPDVERSAPALSHWGLFLDAVPAARIGEDGHPIRGDFLPAVNLPRRMFAAGRLEFASPWEVGVAADCTTTVAAVNHKRGQAGDLVFVELAREITQGSRLIVSERQTIVYRGMDAPIAPISVTLSAPKDAECWCPGPVDLVRFSAVTFNAHRIHYDQQYARLVEGYPDLVVHGPFTAIKLLSLATARSARPIRSFEFRIAAPLFVSQPVYLAAGDAPGHFVATRCDGVIASTAKVESG
jgi:3-methylfumaryl-CoA hydratase